MWKIAQALWVIVLAIYCTACAASRNVQPPLAASEGFPASGKSVIGTASWYGPGFDGHRTSSGAIYHQESLTAASTLFPLGTVLRVTNLSNGRSVDVTVDDHGPYVKGRTLDLSHNAAKTLGMLGPGTTSVRMEILHSPPGGPTLGQRYCIQVGSFRDRRKARKVQERIARICPEATIVEAVEGSGHLYRVRSGIFISRSQAESWAGNLLKLGYSPMIITE